MLPVKGGPAAKSRLRPPPGVDREDLALAIALDAVAAVARCPAVSAVVVVTHDDRVVRSCAGAGPRVAVLREPAPGRGLAAAVADGVAVAGAGRVAVLLPDLPALRPHDLTAALDAAGRALHAPQPPPMVFVADADGTGTVLLASRSARELRPAFGPASAAAHAALGALALDVAAPRLRRDVDTAEALQEAVAAGVGPRTADVLAGAASRV
ncbi:2-phospho-L-lactate guanylyltransferase [Kineococcus xinjiangensis]|uniref:2-phospho-L-lactate guanylyltransferase n=1 Tax=Kineococcus xinjiangensis TaxID=512762 RepID=A0A2S6IW22_9ACTN|nr:2-phospho-L-lactate guanylyltransferase [Kineococcus xinjiangensis]